MGSKWRKAKLALGLNMCLYVPPTQDQESLPQHQSQPPNFSVVSSRHSDSSISPPPLPPSSSSSKSPQSSSKSSKKTCAICLTAMKPGQGHAIFTAECSHSFHFHCITSNVKHGNQICPVCRAKWKEVPFQSPSSDLSHGRATRINPQRMSRDDAWMTVLRQLPSPQLDINRQISPVYPTPEPVVFNDDEVLDQPEPIENNSTTAKDSHGNNPSGTVEVKTYTEVSAVPCALAHNNFTVLVHLKAPLNARHNAPLNQASESQDSWVPVDLVTVLDVSGSMAGTKLALLKRAMGFVIQNLGPSDRLSVIAFSSTARRIFPLRRMNERGRQEALQAVNSLISNGGTNIAEGLRKGAKVLLDRQLKNPVGSIILLSDGQDTYTLTNSSGSQGQSDYMALLPTSIHRNGGVGCQIPVHAFGFGADHDAAAMHSISEISGGTFSFIEDESVIQDAFAQCIGGLLSVVAQKVKVSIECALPNLHISRMKAGNYQTSLTNDGTLGSIEVGDLYAEEERDFLVGVDIPPYSSVAEMPLLKVKCAFWDPISKEMITSNEYHVVKIERPTIAAQQVVSIEVDRQRNRLRAADTMAEARTAAERGDLTSAVSVLESCRRALAETVSARAQDRLCIALCAELKEMQERMANRRVYESSGRAYVLSGLSSHSWQRATARGDSTDSTSLLQAYQTPSMVDMVSRSQTLVFGHPPAQRKLSQSHSLPARPQPR